MFQNENNKNNRLPATISSLKPDCSSFKAAEKLTAQPKDWLLYPTGFVFQFKHKKDESDTEKSANNE